MKYILFLFYILFFNQSLWAQGDGITVNLGKSDFLKPKSEFSKTMDDVDNYSVGTGSDPFRLNPPPNYAYGNASGTINFGRTYCSRENLAACKENYSCVRAGGNWDNLYEKCGTATCHLGTTAEIFYPTRCRCNEDFYAFVERGNFLQQCPSQCRASENKSYAFLSKSCVCSEGFTMASDGSCNANPAARARPESECLREFVEKAAACETDSNKAVSQCDVEEDDTMTALQGLIAGSNGSASENCERAATASTSGYHHADDTRAACDERINSCKTGCGDATTFLNANKERVYNACRERAQQAQVDAGPPLPPDRFNPMWDAENKPTLDSQFQGLIAKIDASRVTCETGTAAKNREKLSESMGELNTASRAANQCVCQLGSTGADCSKSVTAPADCSKDPKLPGCAKLAEVNCYDPNNVTLKCICFRNPESGQCKGPLPVNVKGSEKDASAFAGKKPGNDTRGNNGETSGMAAGNSTEGFSNVGGGIGGSGSGGQNYQANGEPVLTPEAATSSSGNPSAAPAAAAAASSGGGSGSKGTNAVAPTAKNDVGVAGKLSGFFDTAKSALGGLFKKGSGNETSSGEYRDGGHGHNQNIDHARFRPRGMVRGIASEEIFAGKHEDIWKVMNKQYKVQDQKDKFIFEN